jgi:hypothetical protein
MRRHDRRRAVRGLFGIALAVLVAVSAGCAKRGWLETYPVRGTVLVDGKPAKDAMITFHPKAMTGDRPYLPSAQTNENGEFSAGTFAAGDGAPTGEYEITIVWPVRRNPVSTLWEGDKLNGRYANKAKTTLRVTVEKQPLQLPPFELTADPKK